VARSKSVGHSVATVSVCLVVTGEIHLGELIAQQFDQSLQSPRIDADHTVHLRKVQWSGQFELGIDQPTEGVVDGGVTDGIETIGEHRSDDGADFVGVQPPVLAGRDRGRHRSNEVLVQHRAERVVDDMLITDHAQLQHLGRITDQQSGVDQGGHAGADAVGATEPVVGQGQVIAAQGSFEGGGIIVHGVGDARSPLERDGSLDDASHLERSWRPEQTAEQIVVTPTWSTDDLPRHRVVADRQESAANTDARTTMSPLPAVELGVERYAARLHRAVLRRLAASPFSVADRDDIAQNAVEDFLRRGPDRIMARYRLPETWAAVHARHAAITYGRRERRDHAQGTRLVDDGEGGQRPVRQRSRYFVAHPDDATEVPVTELMADDGAVDANSIAERCDRTTIIAALLEGLSARERSILWKVEAEQRSVTAVAAELGLSREHVQRCLGRVRHRVRANSERLEGSASGAC